MLSHVRRAGLLLKCTRSLDQSAIVDCTRKFRLETLGVLGHYSVNFTYTPHDLTKIFLIEIRINTGRGHVEGESKDIRRFCVR